MEITKVSPLAHRISKALAQYDDQDKKRYSVRTNGDAIFIRPVGTNYSFTRFSMAVIIRYAKRNNLAWTIHATQTLNDVSVPEIMIW